MLSTETIARLDQLCDDSHDVFSEGGVVYWFYDFARQADTRILFAPARLRDLYHNYHNADATNAMLKAELDGRTAVLNDTDLDAFSRFLFFARGHAVAFEAALEEALDLIRRLHEDLRFDAVWWETEHDDGWSFDGVLYMMRRSDNRYFALELNCSID